MTRKGVPLKYHLYQYAYVFQDLILPPICVGCHKQGLHWCDECRYKLQPLDEPLCEVCGAKCQKTGICADCLAYPPHFDAVRSFTKYEDPFRKGIIRLKYHGSAALGEIFSVYLIELLLSLQWTFDMILPVPLSGTRRKKRGYNQADYLARPVSYYFGTPYEPYAIQKIRDTRSQVGLTGDERRHNLRGAFRAHANLVAQKAIVLVDDVFTTGSTLNACAQTLKEAGASCIYGITLARPVGYTPQELWDF